MADLYSNCVILDFIEPITRAQLEEIRNMMDDAWVRRGIPRLREHPVCGEREGNSVVPTICADEC